MRATLAAVLLLLAAAAPAAAHPGESGADSPLMRLFGQRDLAEKKSQVPTARAAQAGIAPATPRAECGPGSDPEPGMQGRNAADAPGREDGFRCNTELVGHAASPGGFKALRYVDNAGRECAYYDTTLLFPLNVVSLSSAPTGVAVLDMSDPKNPVRTDTLLAPSMQTPHESLEVNQKRGLIAAVTGNPAAYPGLVDIYDASEDCRHPVMQSSTVTGRFGHESGFAPDGNTFYATSIGTGDVTALDVTDPKAPKVVWVGNYRSHGLMVSDDGNRLYIAAGGGGFAGEGLIILDSSEVQARKPNPQVREVGRVNWPNVTIPQVAIPVTIDGHPYAVEVDEFSASESGEATSHGPRVGAARIIDLGDETKPKVISDIRLEVHQPENRAAIADDPGTMSPVQGYAGHYCNVPSRTDPGIVACSMIASGLRIFDIRDPHNPKELAYFAAPPSEGSSPGSPSNYAMSRPAFVPERGEIWYTDGGSGFYAVRTTNGVWPFTAGSGPGGSGGSGSCTASEGFRSVSAKPAGRGLRLAYDRRKQLPVTVDVFQVSKARRVVQEHRVARFADIETSYLWNPRSLPDGTYFVRFSMLSGGERVDVQRVVLRRSGGRFRPAPLHHRRASCGLLRQFKLERPVFGGTRRTPLRIAYRLSSPARVGVTVRRAGRVVRRFRTLEQSEGRTYRLRLPARGLERGVYSVRLVARSGTQRVVATLRSRRL